MGCGVTSRQTPADSVLSSAKSCRHERASASRESQSAVGVEPWPFGSRCARWCGDGRRVWQRGSAARISTPSGAENLQAVDPTPQAQTLPLAAHSSSFVPATPLARSARSAGVSVHSLRSIRRRERAKKGREQQEQLVEACIREGDTIRCDEMQPAGGDASDSVPFAKPCRHKRASRQPQMRPLQKVRRRQWSLSLLMRPAPLCFTSSILRTSLVSRLQGEVSTDTTDNGHVLMRSLVQPNQWRLGCKRPGAPRKVLAPAFCDTNKFASETKKTRR